MRATELKYIGLLNTLHFIHLYRVIKKSLCIWRLQYTTIRTQLMSWRRPSQNTFGMWTVLYWTRTSRTQYSVSINVWRLAGDTLNTTCNFLHCNHLVHRDFLITLYISSQTFPNTLWFLYNNLPTPGCVSVMMCLNKAVHISLLRLSTSAEGTRQEATRWKEAAVVSLRYVTNLRHSEVLRAVSATDS